MLYPFVTSLPTTLYPKCPFEKEEYKADREGAVHSLTYVLSILNKKHICLLKPLALNPYARLCPKTRCSNIADAGICERK